MEKNQNHHKYLSTEVHIFLSTFIILQKVLKTLVRWNDESIFYPIHTATNQKENQSHNIKMGRLITETNRKAFQFQIEENVL